jgi:ribosomal protein S18 acetylase RimI-like enzyme
MELQLAQTEDLSAVEGIFKNAINKMIQQNIFQWDEVYPNAGTLKNDITKKQMYKLIFDGAIASICVLNQEYDKEYRDGDWAYRGDNFVIVHRLCVNPEYQGRGFGTKTMVCVEEYAKNNGLQSIRLDTFSKNPAALKLYTSLGYKKTGEVNFRKGLFYLFEKVL